MVCVFSRNKVVFVLGERKQGVESLFQFFPSMVAIYVITLQIPKGCYEVRRNLSEVTLTNRFETES
jgi:hypothetical protein